MGFMTILGAGGLLAVFLEGFKPLYFAFFVVVFAVCGWQMWLCLRNDVLPCLRDLWGKPTTVVGRVSSKIYEAPNHHYLVVEDQRFEVNALQYHTVKRGDVTTVSYWPNVASVAGVRHFAAPAVWPAEVVRLAQSLHAGEDCAFALRDALLDAGHPELAAHMTGAAPPQWLIDLILANVPPAASD